MIGGRRVAWIDEQHPWSADRTPSGQAAPRALPRSAGAIPASLFLRAARSSGSCDSAQSQGAFYQPAADAKISHIDARDIARAAAVVLTKPGHEGKAYDPFYADYLIDLSQYYRKGGAGTVTNAVQEVTGRDPVNFEQFVRDKATAF